MIYSWKGKFISTPIKIISFGIIICISHHGDLNAKALDTAETKRFNAALPAEVRLNPNSGKYNQSNYAIEYTISSGSTAKFLLSQQDDSLPTVDNGADPYGNYTPGPPIGGLATGPLTEVDPRIVRVVGDGPNGSYYCTGTLVAPLEVLTAGHCVHQGNGGKFYSNIAVGLGYSNGNVAYGPYKAAKLVTFSGWADSGDNAHDIALIILQSPAPSNMIYKYGMASIDPGCIPYQSVEIDFSRTFYSANFANGQNQYVTHDSNEGCHLGLLESRARTGHGSSGSAEIDPTGQFIYAVHSAEDDWYSFDPLLTRAKICFFYRYIDLGPDPTQYPHCNPPKKN